MEIEKYTAERAVRRVAVGRQNDLVMGSEAGGNSTDIAKPLIETATMNNVNLEAWLAWLLRLSRISQKWIPVLG